ncbi:unnamed protein product [Ectocarpus fasciculatus]
MASLPAAQRWIPDGYTNLHAAAFDNDASKLTDTLLSSGSTDIDRGTPQGRTPLMIAASVTKMLVNAGANLEAAGLRGGWTPLMAAAYQGHSQVVGILLNKGADFSIVDKWGDTALITSALYGHVAVTRMLVNAGADLETAGLRGGWTPLMAAAYKGHSQVVGILLNKGADFSVVDKWGDTALITSARWGHVAVTRMLVNAGADLETADQQGWTPLVIAACEGRSKVVGILLNKGADVSVVGKQGSTALITSSLHGHVAVTRMLVNAGADLEAVDSAGFTPLHAAAFKDHSEHAAVVRELMQQLGIQGCGGASAGEDALRWAVRTQKYDIVVMLTDAGVVDTGRVLIDATYLGNEASVKILLQQQRMTYIDFDTYVNKQQPNGITPVACGIERASLSGSPRFLRLFLDAGADTSSTFRIVNKEGVEVFSGTPLAYTTWFLRLPEAQGTDSTEGRVCGLEAVRRMLLQLEAIHAVSWCWPGDASASIEQAAQDGTPRAKPTLTRDPPMGSVLPGRRRRTRAGRLLVTAASR